MPDPKEGDSKTDAYGLDENGNFSVEHVYPFGRTQREQTVVFNEHYLTPNPKPHVDELGPIFPKAKAPVDGSEQVSHE